MSTGTDWPGHAEHVASICEVRPGLRIHTGDMVDELDATLQGQSTIGLHFVLLLEGRLDLSYGDRHISLTTAYPHKTPDLIGKRTVQKQSFLMNISRPEPFSRRLRQGNYARRLSLNISREWLQQLQKASCTAMPQYLSTLLSGHLFVHFWEPTTRAMALAEQILRPPVYQPMLQAIYLESRILDLLAEVLASLQSPAPVEVDTLREISGLSSRVYHRMTELRGFLSSSSANQLSLDEIAQHMGMNANTMQRQFRSVHGMTIFDFLREVSLQRARLALERDAVNIKQAAALAGYTSPANFATAYKRRFGITPKTAQRSGRR